MMTTPEKINIILKKINFNKASHNEIFFSHFRSFLTILIEDETQEWKTIKYKASISLGINNRYIKEYFKGLDAWRICTLDETDKIQWIINFEGTNGKE